LSTLIVFFFFFVNCVTKKFFIYRRFLHHLKKKVKNKAHVEGSIIESYLIEEIAQFCTYYFETSVQPNNTSIGRTEGDEDLAQSLFPIFNLPGRFAGQCKSRFLEDKEFTAAMNHVLINCDEIQPYIE
jgi:hypothetical protein